jgi:hypothetical protein
MLLGPVLAFFDSSQPFIEAIAFPKNPPSGYFFLLVLSSTNATIALVRIPITGAPNNP